MPLLALLVAAGLAGLVSMRQMRGLPMGPPSWSSLPAFLAMWSTMMAAMMLPSVAPVAILWSRRVIGSRRRALRLTAFLAGYVLVWSAAGLAAFAAMAGIDRLVAQSGRPVLVGAAIYLLAGVYQFTPFKDRCLDKCRSPMSFLMRFTALPPRFRDFRVGFANGLYCIGCCSVLMLIMIPLGLSNVLVMVAVAAVVLAEKLLVRGGQVARVAGAAFVAAALLTGAVPWLVTGLSSPGGAM